MRFVVCFYAIWQSLSCLSGWKSPTPIYRWWRSNPGASPFGFPSALLQEGELIWRSKRHFLLNACLDVSCSDWCKRVWPQLLVVTYNTSRSGNEEISGSDASYQITFSPQQQKKRGFLHANTRTNRVGSQTVVRGSSRGRDEEAGGLPAPPPPPGVRIRVRQVLLWGELHSSAVSWCPALFTGFCFLMVTVITCQMKS